MDESNTALFPLPRATFHQRITLKLDSGLTVERDASDLVELPPHLAVPLEDLEPPT